MNKFNDPAKKYFDKNTTDVIRAVFEATISLVMIYNKLIGMPVNDDPEELRILERAMILSAKKQPYKKDVYVRINEEKVRERIRRKDSQSGPYSYVELDGEMFEIHVLARYGEAYAKVGMKYNDELKYPLMYIEELGGLKG